MVISYFINKFKSLINRVKKLYTSISQGRSLKARTARGGLWLSSATGGEQGLRFIRNMILTRLLAPEAFGVMAIVMAINLFFESFTQVGIAQSILQNPESSDKEYLNGAWWFSFIRGLGIYIIAFVVTPYIAEFYNNQTLIKIMRVAFLSMIFTGLISSNAYIAQKKMDFKKWVIIYQGGGLIGISIAIILAFVIQDVWALVIGFTLEPFARCVLSYVICPFWPGIKFTKTHLSSLFKYARGMLGLPILTFIFLRADIFVVGKVLPMSVLGLYSMAITLARTPFDMITNVLNQLLSPVFSEVQKENEKVNHLVSVSTMGMLYLCVPSIVFCIIFGQEILKFVYGGPYSAVSIPFSIILCSEILKVTGVPIAIFYLMSGKPELHRFFTGIRAIIMIGLIYFGVKFYGLTGAAIVVFLSISVSYGFQLNRMHKITKLNIWGYYSLFIKPLALSLWVVICYLPMRIIFDEGSLAVIAGGLIGLLISVVLGTWFVFKGMSAEVKSLNLLRAIDESGSVARESG